MLLKVGADLVEAGEGAGLGLSELLAGLLRHGSAVERSEDKRRGSSESDPGTATTRGRALTLARRKLRCTGQALDSTLRADSHCPRSV